MKLAQFYKLLCFTLVTGATLFWSTTFTACGGLPEDDETSTKDETGTGSDTDDDGTENSGTTGTGKLAIGPVDDIPQVTDPVKSFAADISSTEAEAARRFDALQIDTTLTTVATKGLKFGAEPKDLQAAFENANNPSEAYCRSMNTAMLALANVSESDLNLCTLKSSLGDAYDQASADYQYANVTIEEDGETIVSKFKFKIETDDDDNVTLFEAFVCEEVDGESLGQIGYQKVTRDGDKLTIAARSFGDEDGLKLRVKMQANLDADNNLVGLKTIDYAETTTGQGMARSVAGKITQSEKNFEFIFFTSAGSDRRFVTFTELVDGNTADAPYAFTNVGFGDGASLLAEQQGSSEETRIEGWDGDTTEIDASEPRIAKVEGRDAELPTVQKDPGDLDLPAAESWDCTASQPIEVELTGAAFETCMERYEIDQDLFNMCSQFDDHRQ